MGIDVYAKVGFGVVLDDATDLPWNDDSFEFDGDLEAWWRAECGWKETRPDGDYESDAVQSFYDRRAKFDEENPPPVELESYGYGDYDTPVLLVAGTGQRTEYEGDLDVDAIAQHAVNEHEDAERLRKFCKKYRIKIGRQKPRWLLFGRCF